MPEVKQNFTGGKMNKDLDERLVPSGQYRDALNIEVSTSEGSNVGTVQNILGNKRIETLVGDDYACVGSVANEKTNKLYWFVSKYDKDMILEYDVEYDIASPVFVDLKAGTEKAVLKFFGNIITGINIIDNLLFWTDNKGEPKKINIDTCKKNTTSINTHTKVDFNLNSFRGIAVEYVWPDKMPNYDDTGATLGGQADNHPPIQPLEERVQTGRRVVYERRKLADMVGYGSENYDDIIDNYGQIIDANNHAVDVSSSHDAPGNATTVNGDGYVFSARHYRDGEYLGLVMMRAWDNTRGTYMEKWIEPADNDFKVGDVIFAGGANVVQQDIKEKHITVIKPKPLKAPSVKINYKEPSVTASKKPNLFEEKFPRFSYRYKYRDGEFSAMAPFTQPVFNPQYTQDTTSNKDGIALYNKDTIYDIKNPHNKAMVNAIHSVDLMDFITIDTPEDVIEVDILYKQEDSPVIYSIETIKHTDHAWHCSIFNSENKHPIVNGAGRYYENMDAAFANKQFMPAADGGYNSGKYTVTTENIYAALPSNQLLRPWDNVPRKALAQEVSGSRIVYGNYLQNYTIGEKPKVFVDYTDRKQLLDSFDTKGLPSVKSQRNYQVGVLYCDKFGRETPVFTSNSGALHVPWSNSSGDKNASKSNQLVASTVSNFPDWVDSIKFFIKQTSGEYYNLTMERAWVKKSTYEIDNSEGHLWISFPSSDRNKISEEDYIVLKKKIGVGEQQIFFENKFKVIDIKNEAPDALKYELVNIGTKDNTSNKLTATVSGQGDKLFMYSDKRPDKLTNELAIDISSWLSGGSFRADLMPASYINQVPAPDGGDAPRDIKDLYFSWHRISTDGTVLSSSKYSASGGWRGTNVFYFNLNRKIEEKDADIAHVNGLSATQTNETNLHPDLHFQVEKKVLKDGEDFSGQFFVKISKNQVSSIIESGSEIHEENKFSINAKQGVWYWQDDPYGSQNPADDPHDYSTNGFAGGNPYGLTNHSGFKQSISSFNNIQSGATSSGATLPYSNSDSDYSGTNGWWDNTNPDNGTARLTDHADMWEAIYNQLATNVGGGNTRWFIDSVHMASGQSSYSDLAKYNCVTWSGVTDGAIPLINGGHQISAWTYPPLKKWWTEINDSELTVDSNPASPGIYYAGSGSGSFSEAITTSQLVDQNSDWTYFDDSDPDPDNHENVGIRMDGWVGVPQDVNRRALTGIEAENHINGLEGFLTTNNYHTAGPRRWVEGMNGTDYGSGRDTKTYCTEQEKGNHFIHLSFFAPGKDLHDDTWSFSEPCIYGEDTFMDNLQGIWGGGVFTGKRYNQKFGSASASEDKHYHLPMEGNYADGEDAGTVRIYSTPPGPGIGYGYNLKYRELHERQWDPTFIETGDSNNKIRDFIRNLYPGSKFRFNHTASGDTDTVSDVDNTTYTIKKVHIKKLYNHTNWRNAYNFFDSVNGGYYPTDINALNVKYRSVEQSAIRFLDSLDVDGNFTSTTGTVSDDPAAIYGTSLFETLKRKIVDFGKAHNRRLCYIIELDKNPADSTSSMGNPADSSTNTDLAMSGGLKLNTFTDIEFVEPVQDVLLSDLSKFPAIWELSPKKQDVELDIYYEASDNIPVRINRRTNELFAPKGCLVEVIDPPSVMPLEEVYLVEWDKNNAVLEPGFPYADADGEINYSNVKFKFIRRDGSFTVAEAGLQQLTSQASGFKTTFTFKPAIAEKIEVGLAWYNCFSFGNGLESNRIKDDFNEMFITNGVKASSTTQETYKEEHRKYGLIYSGLYNSNSGINDLNQFIQAEKITKDLNPIYGSIQKLFSRNTDLVTFCEDKVVKILANKDAVFNADGNPQLTANENVLGQTVPFVGDYGISKNPESFASESYRAYFTDKQRGAVLRLSRDGLTPISKSGMHDWFRDNLSLHTSLIGTYDSYKENYNLTLLNTYTENIIFNTYFQFGADFEEIDVSVLSNIQNGVGIAGSSYEHSWQTRNIGTDDTYDFGSTGGPDQIFKSTIKVTNHPEIPIGHFQQEYFPGQPAAVIAIENQITTDPGDPGTPDIPYAEATFAASSSLPDSGSIHSPVFGNVSGDLFGASRDTGYDTLNGVYANLERTFSAIDTSIYAISVDESTASTALGVGSGPWQMPFLPVYPPVQPSGWTWGADGDPTVEKDYFYPTSALGSSNATNRTTLLNEVSCCITRDKTNGWIIFDRPHPDHSYITVKDLGRDTASGTNWLATGGVNEDYHHDAYGTSTDADSDGVYHNSVYNGDEIHVQVKITAFCDIETSGHVPIVEWGSNAIRPKIELLDNGAAISSNVLVTGLTDSEAQSANSTQNNYKYYQSVPGDITDFNDWTGPIHASSSSSTNEGGYIINSTGNTHSGSDFTTVRNIPGTRSNGVKSNIQKYLDSGEFEFPLTSRMYIYQHMHSSSAANFTAYDPDGHIDIVLGFSLKFRDSNQQDSSGEYTGSGDGITAAKVVDNLQIRISQDSGPGGGTSQTKHSSVTFSGYPPGWPYGGAPSVQPMANPLWLVKEIRVVKGFGIVGADQAFEAGDPYIPPTYATVYDDPTTSNVEEYSVADITGVGGPVTTGYVGGGSLNANGEYVLNQAEIDAYIANPSGSSSYEPPIPSYAVPAFVQVQHLSTNWEFGSTNTSNNVLGQWLQARSSAYFGNPRSAIPDSAVKANGNTVTWYKPGADPQNQQPQEGNYGNEDQFGNPVDYFNKDFGGLITPPGPGTATALSNTGSSPATATFTDFPNQWWRVQLGDAGSYGITFDHAANPMVVGEWYMLDVELDETEHAWVLDQSATPPVGGINIGEGRACVRGAVSVSFNDLDNLNTYGGFGYASGGPGDEHAFTIPYWRTEYGQHRWVLRTVFRLDADSWVNTSSNWKEKINLRFYDVQNTPWFVSKVICKKVSYTNNKGSATNWIRGTNNNEHDQINTFTPSKIYYYSSSLCFDEVYHFNYNYNYPWYNYNNTEWWKQDMSANPIENVGSGWILKFTVGPNPKTGIFSPSTNDSAVNFIATGNFADYANFGGSGSNFTGIIGYGIKDQGEYEVKFTMDGTYDSATWQIFNNTLDPLNQYSLATIDEYGNVWTNTSSAFQDKVGFYVSGVNTEAHSYGISNIMLTQSNTIFSGGQAGSWNYDGFDSTSEQYITWDTYWPNGVVGTDGDGRLQFTGCPRLDPSFDNGNIIISANQYVDHVINRYEKYEVSFNFRMQDQDSETFTAIDGQGLFNMYYFNSSGYGFRINAIGGDVNGGADSNYNTDLGSTTGFLPNYTKTAVYEQVTDPVTGVVTDGDFLWWKVTKIVGIGDGSDEYDSSFGYTPTPGTLSIDDLLISGEASSEYLLGQGEALRDTFVIKAHPFGSGQPVTGWIDNVSMRRVYPIELAEQSDDYSELGSEKTISFSEDVNGWTSFKSFLPEQGLSLSKKYFTIKDGYLHRHYMPMKYDVLASTWQDCLEHEAENYNYFYDHLGNTEAQSYSKVTAVINVEPSVVKTFKTLNYEGTQSFVKNPGDPNFVTTDNSKAWALTDFSQTPVLYPDIEGWRCSSIKTDLDIGTLDKFIKKEGKWFGYIKGVQQDMDGNLNTSKFNVQGLGVCFDIAPAPL